MSNSADEAVFDYFALLLSEGPEDEVKEAPSVQQPKSEPQVKLQPQSRQAEARPVNTQALPATTSLNKRALEQLLAPVAEADAKTETQVQTETAALEQLKAATHVKSTHIKPTTAKPTQVKTETSTVTSTQVKAKIEEKLETSANIKLKDKTVEAVDLTKAPQTQVGATPPGVTEQLVEQLDDEFQVLFFKVAGLTLAVPLVSLGGIVKVERINHIMGRPAWYLGVQTHRDSQLNVVDSGAWVMPEKYDDKLAQSVDYQYIVLLEDSNWGLACESLVNSVKILKSEVNWRTKAGKRPWLAGVVKEQMCGILHVQALIELLNLGLGSQDSIG
ncbi:chemotaxis protein CheW [Shewanella marisflavi]|uniref:chemotaxis protein CheW n=1 Tax=Shewanella marisflavi TaxID=260364 RepID=UPI003AAC7E17